MFVEYSCEITAAEKYAKYETIAQASLVVLVCAAIFIVVNYYMLSVSNLDGYVFDVSTVTV